MAVVERADADLLHAVAAGTREPCGSSTPACDLISVRLSRRCADADAVADVLQDTFVAAWNGAARFRGDGEVGAWLWGIAIRRRVSRLRKRTDFALGPALRDDDRSEISAEE